MRYPLVSVVVPCRDGEKTLRKTLESIRKSNYPNFEVIVVDDGSQDKSPSIIREFTKKDKRFIKITQNKLGVSAARNKGVKLAKGGYIAFLDADDIFFKNSILGRMKVFLKNRDPNLVGVFCPAKTIDLNGKPLSVKIINNHPLPKDRLYLFTLINCAFTPSCAIVRKKAIENAGGFDRAFTFAQDYELWNRMMSKGGYFKKVSSCCVALRFQPFSATHSDVFKVYEKYKMALDKKFSLHNRRLIAKKNRKKRINGMYFSALTGQAFKYSVKAFISGKKTDANKIAADIDKEFLEKINPYNLEAILKYAVLEYLCLPELKWRSHVLPKFRGRIARFIKRLNKRFHNGSKNLFILEKRLEVI